MVSVALRVQRNSRTKVDIANKYGTGYVARSTFVPPKGMPLQCRGAQYVAYVVVG